MGLLPDPRQPAKPFHTGNAEDDARLEEAREAASLLVSRRWSHFLFFTSEPVARAVAAELAGAWECDVLPTPDGSGWTLQATQTGVLLSEVKVTETRAAFTALAKARGGEYDGWRSWL